MIRRRGAGRSQGQVEERLADIDVAGLSDAFAAPRWLRDLGATAWLLVGVALFVAGAVWLLSLTETIVAPLIAATVVASVASPLVSWLARHGVPRGVGTALLLLAIVGLTALVILLVVGGIASQTSDLKGHLADAKDTISGWAHDLGVSSDKAKEATQDASSTSSDAVSKLLKGVASGVQALSSVVFFLALTALSLFFLLVDAPKIRSWGERHMGVPQPVARLTSTQTLRSLRGYFLGVTIVPRSTAWLSGSGPCCSACRWRERSRSSPSSRHTCPTSGPGRPARFRSFWRWGARERVPPWG